jgi:syntaxin 8
MSLAKLTAVSTKTLSLLLERQRLQTLPTFSANGDNANAALNGSSLHYPQIKRNLKQLREGIVALEAQEGPASEAARLLRNQYDRMRGMLWEEERAEIPG